MSKASPTALDLADAQFIGFYHGKRSPGILHLVSSMGLTKEEWVAWKKTYTKSYLTSDEIVEVDVHFGLLDYGPRKFKDEETVIYSVQNLKMVVMSARLCVKGWRYKLGFPRKDGKPNRARETRHYFEEQLEPITSNKKT